MINHQTPEFLAVVEDMKSLYPEGYLSEGEAYQAARNFMSFVKIMLDVDARKRKEES